MYCVGAPWSSREVRLPDRRHHSPPAGTKAYEQSVAAEEIENLVDFYGVPCFYTNIEVALLVFAGLFDCTAGAARVWHRSDADRARRSQRQRTGDWFYAHAAAVPGLRPGQAHRAGDVTRLVHEQSLLIHYRLRARNHDEPVTLMLWHDRAQT